MKATNLLRNAITLVLFAGIMLAGCKKDLDDVQPIPEAEQSGGGLKASATGKILSATVNGDYRTGLILNLKNTVTLKINVYTIGTYNLISNTGNGMTFTKSGNFAYKGIQDVILYGNGTPVSTGVNTYSVSMGTGISFKVVTVSNSAITQSACSGSLTYYEVANHKTQKVWLDRNLGASRVALSSIDYFSYGSMFQWGRLADGHQCMNWSTAYAGVGVNGTSPTFSSSDVPGHSKFIKGFNTYTDWRVPQKHTLWQGASGINNPCPTGYRIPTSTEMNAEVASWNSQNTAGAFGSSLKWATAGYREFYNGSISMAGSAGAVWTSTVANTSKAMILWFASNEAYTLDDFRGTGNAVRCIKN